MECKSVSLQRNVIAQCRKIDWTALFRSVTKQKFIMNVGCAIGMTYWGTVCSNDGYPLKPLIAYHIKVTVHHPLNTKMISLSWEENGGGMIRDVNAVWLQLLSWAQWVNFLFTVQLTKTNYAVLIYGEFHLVYVIWTTACIELVLPLHTGSGST